MEKTMKLSEAQLSFDQWNKVRSECTVGCDNLKILAVEKMAETATTFRNWYTTQVFADELDMTEQKQKAFVMMQKTAGEFSDWYEVAVHCEVVLTAIRKMNRNLDIYTSKEIDEYRSVFEKAKTEMVKTHNGYSDWNKVLTEAPHLHELVYLALNMAVKTAKTPMEGVELCSCDPEDKDLHGVREAISSIDGSFTEWLEAYEEYSPLKSFDNKIKSIVLHKMAESYTTFSEWEKVQEFINNDRNYQYGDLLAKSLTNDQWLTFFGFTE